MGVIAREGTVNVVGGELDDSVDSDWNDDSRINGGLGKGFFGCLEGTGRFSIFDVLDAGVIRKSSVDPLLYLEYLDNVSILTCLMLQDSMLTFLVTGRRLEL